MLWIAPTKLPHAHKHTPVSNGTVQLCEPESEQQTSYRFFGIQSLNNAPTLQRVKERAKRGLRPESAGPMDPVKHLRVNQCRKCSYGLWWKKVKLQDGTPWKHRENEISAILGRLGCPIWPKKNGQLAKSRVIDQNNQNLFCSFAVPGVQEGSFCNIQGKLRNPVFGSI